MNNDTDSKFFEKTAYIYLVRLRKFPKCVILSIKCEILQLFRIFKTLSYILGNWRCTMAQQKTGKLLLFILKMRESWLKWYHSDYIHSDSDQSSVNFQTMLCVLKQSLVYILINIRKIKIGTSSIFLKDFIH